MNLTCHHTHTRSEIWQSYQPSHSHMRARGLEGSLAFSVWETHSTHACVYPKAAFSWLASALTVALFM